MNYKIIQKDNVTESMTVHKTSLNELMVMVESDGLSGFESYKEYSESEAATILTTIPWAPIETDGHAFATHKDLKAYHIEQASLETEGMTMSQLEATYTQAYNNLFN
tara:strand:+ start:942 stop:1262 length:321 start_codon:yes stop_codon:yes gene_type:complete